MLQKKFWNGVEILSLNKNLLKKKLKEISSKIKKNKNVKEVILFGSFHTNHYTPYSDLDIAIVVGESKENFLKRKDKFIDYFSEIPLDVNILVYTEKEIEKLRKEKNRFIENILGGERL